MYCFIMKGFCFSLCAFLVNSVMTMELPEASVNALAVESHLAARQSKVFECIQKKDYRGMKKCVDEGGFLYKHELRTLAEHQDFNFWIEHGHYLITHCPLKEENQVSSVPSLRECALKTLLENRRLDLNKTDAIIAHTVTVLIDMLPALCDTIPTQNKGRVLWFLHKSIAQENKEALKGIIDALTKKSSLQKQIEIARVLAYELSYDQMKIVQQTIGSPLPVLSLNSAPYATIVAILSSAIIEQQMQIRKSYRAFFDAECADINFIPHLRAAMGERLLPFWGGSMLQPKNCKNLQAILQNAQTCKAYCIEELAETLFPAADYMIKKVKDIFW